jgi:predicted negative regulator of RcsB-dependent stress response
MTFVASATDVDWPAAAIAIAGIAFLTVVVSVAIWQVFSTGKTSIASSHDKEYQNLVDELSTVQRDTTAELQKANDALAQLRGQIAELEQSVREVDRVLKAVE